MRRQVRSTSPVWLASLVVAGCSSANVQVPNAASKPWGEAARLSPAVLLPTKVLLGASDLTPVEVTGSGRNILVDRLRVTVSDAGVTRRAATLLPHPRGEVRRLPDRLGAGYLFKFEAARKTLLYQSDTFLGELKPVVSVNATDTAMEFGFDRVYLRRSVNRYGYSDESSLLAVDLADKRLASTAPLPLAAGYGAMVFADGWRGVAEVDLRGPMVTLDAGVSWAPLGVPTSNSTLAVMDGDPVVISTEGKWRVGARGTVAFEPRAAVVPTSPATLKPKHSPLGVSPVRAAVETGYPDSESTAVVLANGSLVRVKLPEGEIVETIPKAHPDPLAKCQPLRFGPAAGDFGFLCSEAEQKTALYRYERPGKLRLSVSLRTARRVTASGNGWLVIAGSCSDPPSDASEGAAGGPPLPAEPLVALHCVVSPQGVTREIKVRGDIGIERVVALADGRTAVLIPPRNGTPGQLTLLEGGKARAVALTLPADADLARMLERGLWLHGFEEREPQVLGGWVENGGTTVGVQVALSGAVTTGEPRFAPSGILAAGRLAVASDESSGFFETVDGGITWRAQAFPFETEWTDRVRSCSPVGCAMQGWTKVGWGEAVTEEPDLPLPPGAASAVEWRLGLRPSLDCTLTSTATPAPAKPFAQPPMAAIPPQPQRYYWDRVEAGRWNSFRNQPPPTITSKEVGFDSGRSDDVVRVHTYVWGEPGDWAKTAKAQLRFDDPFDLAGGPRQTKPFPSPWSDLWEAGRTMRNRDMAAYLDPSGRSAIVTMGSGYGHMFIASDGQAPTIVRDPSGNLFSTQLAPHGAVRSGDTWYLLTRTASHYGGYGYGYGYGYNHIQLFRVRGGVARWWGNYPRLPGGGGVPMAELARRARSEGVALVVSQPAEGSQRLLVYPVDMSTGALQEPRVVPDIGKTPAFFTRCKPDFDGWMLDVPLSPSPTLITPGRLSFQSQWARIRFDGEKTCVDGIATTANLMVDETSKAAAPAKGDADAIPLAVTLSNDGQRRAYQCRVRK